jgi:ubiquinone/menaquinone biosynthesis C-methylase UbiE
MGLYERFILPRLIDVGCGSKPVRKQREKIVPLAAGRVVEIGFGSGMNLPYYDPRQVEHVWALEPSQEMWRRAADVVDSTNLPVEFVEASAEAIPLTSASADTVLVTFTLCSVPDAAAALGEMRRVLKPEGRLVFCEHGAAPDRNVRRWQDRLNPVWRRFAGGCNLNRPIPELIERAGFEVRDLSTMYIPGPRIASFNYWGVATVAPRAGSGNE